MTVSHRQTRCEQREADIIDCDEYEITRSTTTSKSLTVAIQTLVTSIWASVLCIDEDAIPSTKNFYLLGGNSLILGQIVNRLEARLSISINFITVYQHLTIDKMTQYCTSLMALESTNDLIGHNRSIATHGNNICYPASAAQCGLWYLQLLAPQQQLWANAGIALSFNGKVNIEYLILAFHSLLSRHPALLSTFHYEQKSKQLQVKCNSGFISQCLTPSIQVLPKAYIAQHKKKMMSQAFDLEKGPLFRYRWFKTSEVHYELVFIIHHSVMDGWSGNILLSDFATAYNNLCRNYRPTKGRIDENGRDYYQDYCFWQYNYMGSDQYKKDQEYWQNKLAHLPETKLIDETFAVTYLDKVASEVVCHNKGFASTGSIQQRGKKHYGEPITTEHIYVSLTKKVDSEVFKKLSILSNNHKLSVFVLCLAGTKLALSLNFKNDDICIGTPLANRKNAAWEKTVGYFVNVVVLRDKCKHCLTILDYLLHVSATVSEALQHQSLPFQEVVNGSVQTSQEHPLFEVMFVFQNFPSLLSDFADLKVEQHRLDNPMQQYPIKFELVEHNKQLHCFLTYDSRRFSAGLMKKVLSHFERVLKEIVENPKLPLNGLPISLAANDK